LAAAGVEAPQQHLGELGVGHLGGGAGEGIGTDAVSYRRLTVVRPSATGRAAQSASRKTK
jgi:hypothetical protein